LSNTKVINTIHNGSLNQLKSDTYNQDHLLVYIN